MVVNGFRRLTSLIYFAGKAAKTHAVLMRIKSFMKNENKKFHEKF